MESDRAVALEAEHTILVRMLRAALDRDTWMGSNEEGETYITCDVCYRSAWGDNPDSIVHKLDCRYTALSMPLASEVPNGC